MTKNEVNKFRKVLEAKVIEFSDSIRRRDAIRIEATAEEIERRLGAIERELAMQRLESESLKLREVRAALQRMQEGAFGVCRECEEPISPKRLAAMPSAALCIRCQEAVDCRCGAKGEKHHVAASFAMAA